VRAALYLLPLLLGAGLLAGSYWHWRRLTERERFFLAMKQAVGAERMGPDEKTRLRLLRSPWWAVWRWLPDLQRQLLS
jgi:hypothetical protein